jgi:hypothetical protein
MRSGRAGELARALAHLPAAERPQTVGLTGERGSSALDIPVAPMAAVSADGGSGDSAPPKRSAMVFPRGLVVRRAVSVKRVVQRPLGKQNAIGAHHRRDLRGRQHARDHVWVQFVDFKKSDWGWRSDRREAPCAVGPDRAIGAGLLPPPIEPCMRFSRTRLTDVLHRRHSASAASPRSAWGRRRFRCVEQAQQIG